MAEELKLKVEERQLDKTNNKIRREGKIPAILYGHGVKNIPLEVNYKDFFHILGLAGETSLVSLLFGKGKKRKVIIREVQKDPVSSNFIHVDFYQVKMTEKLTAEVILLFKGVSKAVIEKGGILVKNLSEIEVKALPQDLPREIIVDISVLENINDVIKVKDLKISDKVEVLEDKNEVVAVVMPPRTEEELKELEEKPEEDVEKVEGIKKEEEPASAEAMAGKEGAEEGAEKGAEKAPKEEKKEKTPKKEKEKNKNS